MEHNKIGKVTNSKQDSWDDWYVKLVDDRHNTGGYLLLHSPQRDFQSMGYDDWFLELDEVYKYIADKNLSIEWEDH